MDFEKLFEEYQEKNLSGRYITLKEIEPILASYKKGSVKEIGKSVEEKPIYSYQIGTGKIKILMWSQMHGNESTTTKALFDFFNVLHSDSNIAEIFLSNYSFYCIPILNPDGAKNYTRVNSNEVDLNRDFQDLSQPESNLLLKIYNEFKPDFCYNLHDQRTIFAAGNTQNPATVSFLAPSYNESREINDVRLKAINVIVAMNNVLQGFIPNQVGRFDDGFNLNCAGDMFQYLNTPTILFEAGHFSHDYEREKTRKYIFIALISGLQFIYENDIVRNETDKYFNIPQNLPIFYDFIYKNIKIYYDNKQIITNFAFQFKEVLEGDDIKFVATLIAIGELKDNFGHFEYDADGAAYSDDEENIPKLEQNINFYLGDKVKIVNGLPKI